MQAEARVPSSQKQKSGLGNKVVFRHAATAGLARAVAWFFRRLRFDFLERENY
jgi:hypothetical protein